VELRFKFDPVVWGTANRGLSSRASQLNNSIARQFFARPGNTPF
jgi:hypothetical protein